jgi:hypothetical protein
MCPGFRTYDQSGREAERGHVPLAIVVLSRQKRGSLLPEVSVDRARLFGNEFRPALADRVDLPVGVEGMVVGLD